MFYTDNEHEESFQTLVQTHGAARDKEYLAACYVLTADDELRQKAARFIHLDGISWLRIWEQDWSSEYPLLLELGLYLFSGAGKVRLPYALRTWTDAHYRVAVQAIDIFRNGLP